jgi:hypothetical protein
VQDQQEVGGFAPGAKVVVEQLDDLNWRVLQAFSYTGEQGETFTVPVGMRTDFASVPRVFVWFLPRYGRYTTAAILHDYLWRERAAQGTLSYIDADGLFRRAMRELGVPFLKRWIMWAAVRWAALFKPNGTRQWLSELPRLLLVSVPALALLLPPGLVVALALAVFYVIEFLLFVPLSAGRRRKQVNRPTWDWWT